MQAKSFYFVMYFIYNERMINWIEGTEQVLEAAWKEGRNQLYEYEVYAVLKLLGMRTPEHRKVQTEEA